MSHALVLLKSAGLKLTQPRQSLLRAIVRIPGPFTAEELSNEAKKALKPSARQGAPDLVTVYRSLSSFTEAGILERVDLGDGIVRYELTGENDQHHHHIICTRCRKIEPVSFCAIQGQEQILTQMGYSDLSHRLEFFGVCPACARTDR